MHARLAIVLLAAVMLASPLGACGGGGAKSETTQSIKTTTKGQELLDLKTAYDAGAMSEAEYQKQRQEILDREE